MLLKKTRKKRCDLEPNHTHFLLFDDGATQMLKMFFHYEQKLKMYSRQIT